MSKQAYTPSYYQTVSPGSAESAQAVVPLVCSFIQPQSVIDVGCGVGTWLAVWEQCGVTDYTGLDGDYVKPEQLRIPIKNFKSVDLEKEIVADRKYELVTCLEVAEHIRPQHAASFIASLCRLGNVVLFSAAIPGQGGVLHYNEQYPEYWAGLFAANGFTGYDCLRSKLWTNKKIDTCYRQNIFFFVNGKVVENYPAIAACKGPLLALVHPEHFEQKERVIASYKKIVSTPFHAGWHFLKSFARLFQKNKNR